jgi:hypothetical protein
MLHACLHTNLLTRCHSASSLFSAVLCFRKVTQEIFSELDETKAKPPIFMEASRRPKMRRRRARGQPHHQVVRPSPWPRPPVVRPPGPTSDAALSPISFLDGKNLKDGSLFHETYCKPPPSLSRDRDDPGALPGTLPERGIPAGGLLYHHGRLRSDV